MTYKQKALKDESPQGRVFWKAKPGCGAQVFIFFHPDYTVGIGVSPIQSGLLGHGVAGFTAGRELHPALKI